MRILFCNYEYPPIGGGGGVFTGLLAQEMAKSHEVTVLTSDGFGLPRSRTEAGVRVIRVPILFRKRKSVASMRSMFSYLFSGAAIGRTLMKEERFDIINTHFVLPTGPVGDFLSHSAGVPNAISLIGGDLYDPTKSTSPHRHPMFRMSVRWLLARADIVIGGSRDTLNNMRRFYTQKIPGRRIPLGIRLPRLNSYSKEDLGFRSTDQLLITVGRLVRRKAVGQLIDMMSTFKNRPVHLLIVGSGPLREELESQTKILGLTDQVHFTGWVDGEPKYQLFQASDVYVSPTQHEGFGLSFLEAMACGLPVVSYEHGGQTDFLVNGQTGFLVPLNDLEELTERSSYLLSEPDLRQTMGETNQLRVKKYSIEEVASMYEASFRAATEDIAMQETPIAHEPQATL